jgi:serine phosphatase RsbU (regulator of sigma subunit)
MPEADWTANGVRVEPKSRLVMFTDGITEMYDGGGNAFGRQRVTELLAETSLQNPTEAVSQIETRLSEFHGGRHYLDDVTLVLVEFLAKDAFSAKELECAESSADGD